jgi:hypothetical protein
MVVVVDSQSAQTFNLEIRPLLCCVADPLAMQLPNISACATSSSQADLDCALAAAVSAVGSSCLDDWSPACIAAADLACTYTCP